MESQPQEQRRRDSTEAGFRFWSVFLGVSAVWGPVMPSRAERVRVQFPDDDVICPFKAVIHKHGVLSSARWP